MPYLFANCQRKIKSQIGPGSGFWGDGWFSQGVSADFFKDKFPVIVCHVLTVYFVTSMFTVCSSFGFISKFVLFSEFSSILSYRVSLRPTRLPVDMYNRVYLCFLSFIRHHQFLFSPLFPPPSFYPSQLYPLFLLLKYEKISTKKSSPHSPHNHVTSCTNCSSSFFC